jgi:cell division protein FtsI/penicillin-binding protein 2
MEGLLAHTEVRKSRVLMAAAGLFLCLLTLWARLVWLQIVCHERFEARAERNQEQRVLLPPVRGELLDRHGRPLARDLVTCAISAAPGEMKDKRATARELGRLLGKDPRVLERAFARRTCEELVRGGWRQPVGPAWLAVELEHHRQPRPLPRVGCA